MIQATKQTDIARFLPAQRHPFGSYAQALKEIRSGRKTSHWIWYVFPQLRGLGHSGMSTYYGIEGIDEARRYLKQRTLHKRLVEITKATIAHAGNSTALDIFGPIDEVKVRSCWTLFLHAAEKPEDKQLFAGALDLFYCGQRCKLTEQMLFSSDSQHR